MDFFLSFGLILCIFFLIILYRKLDDSQKSQHSLIRQHQELTDKNKSLQSTVSSLTGQLQAEKSNHSFLTNSLQDKIDDSLSSYKSLLSQKKSSEVRLGHIAEKLAPFLDYFTFDPHDAVFLGQPIDYVVFEEDGIVFVEIKSGNSKLSAKQKNIKDLVKNKQISWKEIRIK